MTLRQTRPGTLAAVLCLAASAATAQVNIVFDYTYDTGFFSGANIGNRAYLEGAGDYVETLIGGTALSAITPGGGNTWNSIIFDPRNTSQTLSIANPVVPANTIIVYAGAYDLGENTLGIGGFGGFNGSGSTSFFNDIQYRSNDDLRFRTGIGSITFDSVTNWHFDSDITTVESFPGQYDFFSVATHELFHLLGFGTNGTWISLTDPGSVFTGPASVAEFGGSVPLSGGHWSQELLSTAYGSGAPQTPVMVPLLTPNTRLYATDLDVAALNDLGYMPIPEPASLALLGAAAWLGAGRRRREQLPEGVS